MARMVRLIFIHKFTQTKTMSEPMPIQDAQLWIMETYDSEERMPCCLFDYEIVSSDYVLRG